MPGLPYLRKLSLDYFKISVILSLRVLKYGNISQKSWKLNTRTFPFQASCATLIGGENDFRKWKLPPASAVAILHGSQLKKWLLILFSLLNEASRGIASKGASKTKNAKQVDYRGLVATATSGLDTINISGSREQKNHIYRYFRIDYHIQLSLIYLWHVKLWLMLS